jgi:peptide/nickel transport system permease protein
MNLRKKAAGALVAAVGALLLVSLFLDLVPGDPVELMLGEQASTVNREALRHAVGLDLPAYAQVGRFVKGLATGELATSLPPFQDKVLPRIGRALPRTAVLAAASLLVALLVSVPLGALAAARRGTWLDRGAMAFAVGGASVPRFLLGPVFILVFSVRLGWLPVSGADSLAHLVLPAVTLGLAMAALLSRLVRSTTIEALREEYVAVARAKGLTEAQVLVRHALRNAMLPVLTVLGLELGSLLGGAIITEKVFAWPGLGTLLLTGIERRDYNLVRACVLVFTVTYVVVHLLVDVVHALLDPRLRERA